MRRELDWDNPWVLPVVGVLLAALFAHSLWGQYQAGHWMPSQADALWGIAGLTFGIACVIPDVVLYRRRGDAFFQRRRSGSRQTAPSWSLLVFVLVLAVPKYLVPPVTREDEVLFTAGACLGLIAWYPHKRAVWKRMRELKEQAADPAQARIDRGAPQ